MIFGLMVGLAAATVAHQVVWRYGHPVVVWKKLGHTVEVKPPEAK